MCWLTKAAEVQPLADYNDPQGFYQSMRAVYEPSVNDPEQPINLSNKTIITEMHKLLAWWKYHFATLLNKLSTVEQHAVDSIEQSPFQTWIK